MIEANNPDVVLDSPHQVSLTTTSLSSHCDGEDVSVQIENQGLWTVFVEALERQHPEVMEIVPINQRLAPGEALEVVVVRCLGSMTLRSRSGTTRASSIASASRHRSCQPSPFSSLQAVPSLPKLRTSRWW